MDTETADDADIPGLQPLSLRHLRHPRGSRPPFRTGCVLCWAVQERHCYAPVFLTGWRMTVFSLSGAVRRGSLR